MKDLKLVFIYLLPITFFCFDIPSAKAACENFHAVGWYRYTNKEVGQISKKINGRAWNCGNAYSIGNGFRSDEFSASGGICISKERCGEKYLPKEGKKSWIYGSIEDSSSIGSYRLIDLKRFSKEGQLPLYHQCVQQDSSHIEYCWKAINRMQYNWRQ